MARASKIHRLRRAALVSLGAAVLSLWPLGAAVLLEGCGSDSTGGHRVVLHTRLGLDAASREGFTTAAGWRVTLTRALLVAGPFYYYDGAPPLASRAPAPRAWEYAQRWLGLSTAAAHPQHYKFGNVRGQMEAVTSVDLLGEMAQLPEGEGVSGLYRSARYTFSPSPRGPVASELEGHAVLTEGVAEKDGQDARYFRAFVDVADLNKSVVEGQVDGCLFHEVQIETDGTVTLRVHPRAWFNLVNFAELDPGSEAEPTVFPDDSQPKIAFAQGVAQLSAYELSFEEDGKSKP